MKLMKCTGMAIEATRRRPVWISSGMKPREVLSDINYLYQNIYIFIADSEINWMSLVASVWYPSHGRDVWIGYKIRGNVGWHYVLKVNIEIIYLFLQWWRAQDSRYDIQEQDVDCYMWQQRDRIKRTRIVWMKLLNKCI